jgi:hypothetical protein
VRIAAYLLPPRVWTNRFWDSESKCHGAKSRYYCDSLLPHPHEEGDMHYMTHGKNSTCTLGQKSADSPSTTTR